MQPLARGGDGVSLSRRSPVHVFGRRSGAATLRCPDHRVRARGDRLRGSRANVLSFERRRAFVELYGERPWEGGYIGGRLIYAVGGPGIAAGGLLRRH